MRILTCTTKQINDTCTCINILHCSFSSQINLLKIISNILAAIQLPSTDEGGQIAAKTFGIIFNKLISEKEIIMSQSAQPSH